MHLTYPVYSFFFQAEDGIRYPLVTGVQTCALPISAVGPHQPARRIATTGEDEQHARSDVESRIEARQHGSEDHRRHELTRSEERRVGKERRDERSSRKWKKKKESTERRI